MKWLKKYCYFILLAGAGIGYLSLIDHWQIYKEPLAQVKSWQESFSEEEDPERSKRLSAAFDLAAADAAGWMELVRAQAGGEASGALEEGGEQGGTEPYDPSEQLPEGSDPEGSEAADPSQPQEAEPVYCTVEDEYFRDAVFIGDSRTVGMFEYGGLEEISTFYASTGLTVYKIFDAEIASVPGEKKKVTVEEALGSNSFAKIYLMIGINEMGTGTVDTFLEKYREVVEHLKELQPDAIIYLQAIIKVTSERSAQGDYINNEGIVARNEGIAQMADNVKTFYLDVNPYICDETGGMEPSYTFDGVHLKAKYIEIWKDFLKTHAISS